MTKAKFFSYKASKEPAFYICLPQTFVVCCPETRQLLD